MFTPVLFKTARSALILSPIIMEFSLERSIEILERTPIMLESYLGGISQEWQRNNEGEDTWSPYDIVGHLVFGEKTDWIVRLKIILSETENKVFAPFDRFAQMNGDSNTSISDLLVEFKTLREQNLKELHSMGLTKSDFVRTGMHPDLGEVTLKQLIATWVVHDLGHIAQISRVMAHQYKMEVGPWKEYLRILN